ncbi:hypothetical protein F0P96_02080 [Hymenobacter busanensis]|uniref:Uncharacterized protein n=1 Tax=Hymenobacter busanensis TaxID=2607656 RepID=A0A7L4ZUF4_9BACT|nr:hypothetical protein [Hymenobacter busanensis]KAA9339431.1 hypothetical protein F0P96_02080 [Hymenobacter busanensis]QHJ06811.1 hypothetical protein GUY19_05670 [Hymenobacter busanensis]
MKKIIATAVLAASVAFGTQAQQAPVKKAAVQQRADRLSNQMARELRLNNYQTTKLRAINEDKVAKMAAIEAKNAGNAKLIDEQCLGVCKERDRELRNVLTTEQYSAYFGNRANYYAYDKNYALQSSDIMLVKSVQNPLPASAKGATIGQTKEVTKSGGSSR